MLYKLENACKLEQSRRQFLNCARGESIQQLSWSVKFRKSNWLPWGSGDKWTAIHDKQQIHFVK